MTLKEFSDWVYTKYDFDCYENELFEASVIASYELFRNSTYNEVSLLKYYKGEIAYEKLLSSYIGHIKNLFVAIPETSSGINLNIHGVNLNKFRNQKNELKEKVTELEDRIDFIED